jgi:hypothetical protein
MKKSPYHKIKRIDLYVRGALAAAAAVLVVTVE